ncbi:MAG: hypothetical protein FWF87_06040 [Synergistaceae bacterium]|nr:hypothetical protein [Synergistaceae bacterium]
MSKCKITSSKEQILAMHNELTIKHGGSDGLRDEGTEMVNKISIRFFDDREVRAVWDDEHHTKIHNGHIASMT